MATTELLSAFSIIEYLFGTVALPGFVGRRGYGASRRPIRRPPTKSIWILKSLSVFDF
ncbi:hypothetical protein [Amycolatopsis sp. NPDC059657]|uniref:hypothetical protein n=1 Tax=Amycolatopsis sp. NPDC059657 TaxID=3346899 RepID=UPI00366BDB83